MDEIREILAVARKLESAVPKIPGVSGARLKKWLERLRENTLSGVSDSYDGAGWGAEWRVTKVDGKDVMDADFVKAWGGEDISLGAIGTYDKCPPEAIQAVNVALSRALKSKTFTGKAVFAWEYDAYAFHHGREVIPKVGDTFWSTGDSFAGGRFGEHFVEEDVIVKVRRAVYRKRDEEIAVAAEFKTR